MSGKALLACCLLYDSRNSEVEAGQTKKTALKEKGRYSIPVDTVLVLSSPLPYPVFHFPFPLCDHLLFLSILVLSSIQLCSICVVFSLFFLVPLFSL